MHLCNRKQINQTNIMETTNKHTEALKITGDWGIQAKALKEKYSQLTDADLKFEPGKESELLSRIALKINKTNEEVLNIIKKGQPAKI